MNKGGPQKRGHPAVSDTRTALLWAVGCVLFLLLVLGGRRAVYFLPANRPAPVAASLRLADDSADLTILYHERRPYYTVFDGTVRGLCVDPVQRAAGRAGIRLAWAEVPAIRQLELIRENEEPICALGWFKTPAREAFARFSEPIYRDMPGLALSRAMDERIPPLTPLAGIIGNRRLILLRKAGYSYGGPIDQLIASLAPRDVVTSADNMGMLRMLHAHRADYFFIAEEEADVLLNAGGVSNGAFQRVRFTDMPSGNRRYLVCSRQVSPELIDRINAALAEERPGGADGEGGRP